MIAASYVQPGTGGKVITPPHPHRVAPWSLLLTWTCWVKIRLMNLAPDTKAAGMQTAGNSGGGVLASNIAFSLGSKWGSAAASTPLTFDFTDDSDSPPKSIGSVPATLPEAPLGMTAYLLGMQNNTSGFKIQAVALVDAPEGGVCKPKDATEY
eukprot:SAG31_NODE_8472_length_1445_cov_0.879643_2_plen_153_part_00